ncbi:MAG: citrate lyase holo-[acyl-carrier protein] synthase [Deltaproteobacteria bacterium]|nr:citrate lyase holo-[acyl-carrier protein] synthase [Deltaproteobacteria bacterium]
MNTRERLLAPQSPAPSLEAVLANRENRAKRQKTLLGRGWETVISFCVNMPGPVKDNLAGRIIYQAGITALEEIFALAGFFVGERMETREPTGWECLLAVNENPQGIKEMMIALEESHPLGRLFDLDVLGADGAALSRVEMGHAPRPCLLCGDVAAVCARSRKHGLELVLKQVSRMAAAFQRTAKKAQGPSGPRSRRD